MDSLEESLTTYIIGPLLMDAVPADEPASVAGLGFLSSPQQRTAAGLALLSAVAVGAFAVWRYRERST